MHKKRIRKEYKMRPADMGVFQIRNLASGKVFVGRAQDLNGMLNSERFRLRNGLHANAELQRDFRELGEESFEFTVLDRLAVRECGGDAAADLKALEELWLEKLRPFAGRGYHREKG